MTYPRTELPLGEMTRRQVAVMEFIRTYIFQHGYAPSMREIGKGSGLHSTSSVSYVLDCLVARGAIRRDYAVPRGLVLCEPKS